MASLFNLVLILSNALPQRGNIFVENATNGILAPSGRHL